MVMEPGFIALEFEGGLHAGSGLCEALDAAGIDCHVPCADHHDAGMPPEGDRFTSPAASVGAPLGAIAFRDASESIAPKGRS